MAGKRALAKIKRFTNTETGEYIEEEEYFSVHLNTEEFLIFYKTGILEQIKLKSINQYKVCLLLAFNAEFNTNVINLSTQRRIEFANEMDISVAVFNNALKALHDKGFLINRKGEIQMNSHYYFRGEKSERKKVKEQWYTVTNGDESQYEE